MIPKKSSKLYKTVAEDLNISEALVEDLVEYTYKDLRENLTDLKHPRINMEGLGHFVARTVSIRKDIEKYTKMLTTHDTSTFSAYFNKKTLEKKLELIIKLEKEITVQEEKKNKFKAKKNESIDTNLAGETQDPGGN